MRQPVNVIDAVREARRPSFSSGFPTANPGASAGTTNAEIPFFPAFGSVRANTTYQEAKPALVIHAFSPSSTQVSSSRRAVVRIDEGSEPAPGSVRPKPPSLPLAAISGSTRSFTTSPPNVWIGHAQTEFVTLMVTATDGQTRASSSTAIA